ncbi:MAG: hypothetical protein V7707_18595 [Motiliproteus sp.]
MVTNPTERRLFRQEQHQPHSDCLVCFLIENSGSMKQHIESIAMLVDVFSRAFEQAGARSEILGFTTGSWNGGKPFKECRAGAKKADPGRLNEFCHIVYKDAENPWCRAVPARKSQRCSKLRYFAKASTAKPCCGPTSGCRPARLRAKPLFERNADNNRDTTILADKSPRVDLYHTATPLRPSTQSVALII